MRIFLIIVIGLICSVSNAADTKIKPIGLQPPSCKVIINGEQRLKTVEEQAAVSVFFSKLGLAIEQKNEQAFLALINFSEAIDTKKNELTNFIQDFLSSENLPLSMAVVSECINNSMIQEMTNFGVSFTQSGQQQFTSNEGVLYQTNHPAFYTVSFKLSREVQEDGSIETYTYNLWAGPHDGKIMFTIEVPSNLDIN